MKKNESAFRLALAMVSNEDPSLQFLLLILIFLGWINLSKYIYYHKFSSFYWNYFLSIDPIWLDLTLLWKTINLSICFRIYATFINQRIVTNVYVGYYGWLPQFRFLFIQFQYFKCYFIRHQNWSSLALECSSSKRNKCFSFLLVLKN